MLILYSCARYPRKYLGSTSFIFASYYGHVELVKFLMEQNVDVNDTDDDGELVLPDHG